MTAKRITQRIPNSQRKRPQIKLTLDPRALALLQAMRGQASRYVSELVLRDRKRLAKRKERDNSGLF